MTSTFMLVQVVRAGRPGWIVAVLAAWVLLTIGLIVQGAEIDARKAQAE